MRAAGSVLVFLALAAVAGPAAAELYQWTDGEDVIHYTQDARTIPRPYRDGARTVPAPHARPPAATAPDAGLDPTVVPYRAGAPIVVPVRLNGTPLALILDTGADRTVVSPSAIARAGLSGPAGAAVNIVGVTGGSVATELTVASVDVAGARVGPLTILVHDVAVQGADGLLGRDVLDAFTLTVDAARGRAVLAPR